MERIFLWPEGCAPYMDACGGQAAPSLEAYPVSGSRGAVIVCPGGAYARKAEHEGSPIAGMINEAGVSAYVLDYRVCPCPHDAPLGDALRAVRVVRAMGYERIAILGFSAGGNLACCAATLYTPGDADADDPIERLSSRPDGLISCYSVVSFGAHAHIGSRDNLLGREHMNPTLLRRYSAQENVTEDTPPAFIWHTAQDASVPVENSLMLAGAYAKKGVPFALHVFPYGRHGLGLAEEIPDTAQWTALLKRWLLENGYGGRGECYE